VSVINLFAEVKDNKEVHFEYYRDGNLWYKTESGFSFPVPVDDIGNATFKAVDKALLFMRYIRKHAELIDRGSSNGRT
jgi:hypothetical protein